MTISTWPFTLGLILLAVVYSIFSPFTVMAGDSYTQARQRMVSELAGDRQNITKARVLAAMGKVPRHEFVPGNVRSQAYLSRTLPIGPGQPISEPYVVAFMTEKINPQPTERVLEIGTGSGYQAAVLAELTAQVYTIEIITDLANRAATAQGGDAGAGDQLGGPVQRFHRGGHQPSLPASAVPEFGRQHDAGGDVPRHHAERFSPGPTDSDCDV